MEPKPLTVGSTEWLTIGPPGDSLSILTETYLIKHQFPDAYLQWGEGKHTGIWVVLPSSI